MDLPDLEDRRVLLAVSGSIAAYKGAELCRLLVRSGARVQVMMTAAARRLVGEATFAALSGRMVATELFDPQQEGQIGHVRAADEAELLLLAPATANVLAKMATGIADDLVSTVYLAFAGPTLIAPAMNVNMWEHPATRRNVALLRERGHAFVGPASGEMACGHVGAGRVAEPVEILEAAWSCLARQSLAGRRVLVSAGPTREAIDPVRFVANRSSGRMGYAIATEARARGAEVVLVSGPSALPPPPGIQIETVNSAAEMAAAIHARAGAQDVVIMAAAVADFRPVAPLPAKLKKAAAGDRLTLELERTEDILATLGRQRPPGLRLLVGFAAETVASDEELDRRAMDKLAAKHCDLLVANNVAEADAGFEVATNRVTLYRVGAPPERLPLLAKRLVAGRILERVAELLDDRGVTP